MRKSRLSVYLEPELMKRLAAHADRRGRSLSLVAEAAIGAFLEEEAGGTAHAAISRRLDRLSRQFSRQERDLVIAIETLALLTRHYLSTTPSLAGVTLEAREAAKARGRARFEEFVAVLGRRLAGSRRFTQEVAAEEPVGGEDQGSQ